MRHLGKQPGMILLRRMHLFCESLSFSYRRMTGHSMLVCLMVQSPTSCSCTVVFLHNSAKRSARAVACAQPPLCIKVCVEGTLALSVKRALELCQARTGTASIRDTSVNSVASVVVQLANIWISNAAKCERAMLRPQTSFVAEELNLRHLGHLRQLMLPVHQVL